MIDFYNHVARYFVLSHVSESDFLQKYYQPNWSLLPNIGMDVVGVALMKVLPPLLAAKVAVVGIFATIYLGVLLLNRQLTGRINLLVAILTVPLLYSYILIWGFANFLFGLGLSLCAAAWWLAMRRRLAIALPVACGFAIIIFLVHGLTFALYGLLLGCLEIGLFLSAQPKRIGDAVKLVAALLVQAVIPVALFMTTTTAESSVGITNADESIRKLATNGDLQQRIVELLQYRLETIVRVAEGPNFAFDLFTFSLTAVVILAMIARGTLAVSRTARPAIALASVLVVVTPPALFGVGYVADRMPLFLALISIAALQQPLSQRWSDRPLVLALACLVALRIGYIGWDWRQYEQHFQEYETVARTIPPRSLTTGIMVALDKRNTAEPRCEMYGPLLVALHGQAGPLFANGTQQPLKLVGALLAANDQLPRSRGLKDDAAPAFYSEVVAKAAEGGGFSHILMCQADRLTRPLPPGTGVVAKTEHFTLIRLHPPGGEQGKAS